MTGRTNPSSLVRQAPPEPVQSCLSAERLGMERAMLEAVVANEVGRLEDIDRYLKCTLLSATTGVTEVRRA